MGIHRAMGAKYVARMADVATGGGGERASGSGIEIAGFSERVASPGVGNLKQPALSRFWANFRECEQTEEATT